MNELQPMVALNVYMTPEFRRQLLSEVLKRLGTLEPTTRDQLASYIKEKIKVSGFRNSLNAPIGLTLRSMETLFENDSNFDSYVLAAWMELFGQQTNVISEFLPKLGFTMISQVEQRNNPEKSFAVGWPKGITYDSLFLSMKEKINDLVLNKDELALITIMLTGRLPGEFAS